MGEKNNPQEKNTQVLNGERKKVICMQKCRKKASSE